MRRNASTGNRFQLEYRRAIESDSIDSVHRAIFERFALSTQSGNLFTPLTEAPPRFARLLDSFQFSATESAQPNNHVTPTMLARAYESTIENRTHSGVFYSPRAIVEFMCRQSISHALGGYERLIHDGATDGIDSSDAAAMIDRLRRLRILDPACGCGEFLVEMLDVLVEVRERFESVVHSRKPNRARIIREVIAANLFGADRDPNALDIARRRLLLKLVERDKRRSSIKELDRVNLSRLDTIADPSSPIAFAGSKTIDTFDIVITNPPYGAHVDRALRDLYFDAKIEGKQSSDTYGLFIAHALQLLKPCGHLCLLVSDTWRTIRSHRPLRRRLTQSTSIDYVIDLPAWIFDATVNTCILAATSGEPREDHPIVTANLRHIAKEDWNSLNANLRAVGKQGREAQHESFARYTCVQGSIAQHPNTPVFIGSSRLFDLMNDRRFVRLGDLANVRQGLATADNRSYLRKREGARGSYDLIDDREVLPAEELADLSDDEKLNGIDPCHRRDRWFVPYDKGGASDADGGWLPNYFAPTDYFIDWSRKSVDRMKTTRSDKQQGRIGARFQNSDCYFKPGITASYTGFYAPTFRLNSCGVFDVGGSSIFDLQLPVNVGLAFLASRLNRYVAKVFVDHTVNFQVDELKELLLPRIDRANEQQCKILDNLDRLVRSIIDKQATDRRYSYHLFEQREIDMLVYEYSGITAADTCEIELWFSRRYPKLAAMKAVDRR